MPNKRRLQLDHATSSLLTSLLFKASLNQCMNKERTHTITISRPDDCFRLRSCAIQTLVGRSNQGRVPTNGTKTYFE